MNDQKHLGKEKFAAAMGREPSLEVVDDKGRTDLHHAATLSLPALTTSLLNSGMDVHAKDKEKMTPLHSAAIRNAVEGAEFLLNNGADVNAKNSDGWTPLFLATHKKDIVSVVLRFLGFETRMVRLLRWHGGEE